MFLFALTKGGIADNFHSVKFEECTLHSWKATIVTDNFLSKYVSDAEGFSIIESPLINTSNDENNIFLRISYSAKENRITVFKSTISGRPVYYHINSKGEFFCSSHISLLRTAGVLIEENTTVLPEFFVFRFVMPPNTLYKNIYQLFCGGILNLSITKTKCTIKSTTMYQPPPHDTTVTSNKENAKKIYGLLTESLKQLTPRKAETIVLLSGGLDSSVLTKISQSNSITNQSYSTRYPFENPQYDLEKEYSLSAAKALHVEHTFYEPSNQEYLIGFLEAINTAEEPLHHLQSVLFHLLFKKGVPKEKKLIIHGQGAGTTFGSNDFLYIQNRLYFKFLLNSTPLNIIQKTSKLSPRAKKLVTILDKSIIKDNYQDPRNPLWSWMDFGSKQWAYNHFHISENELIKDRYNFIKNLQNLSFYNIWALYSLFSDEQMTLSIWSKIGEGNKKILYFPYYDKTVLDYALSIPWHIKLHKPLDDLRKKIATQAQIPKFIIKRKKSSLGIKTNQWAEKNGLFEPILPLVSTVFDIQDIRKMQSNEPKHSMTYWNMLNYSIWKRLFINNEPLENLIEELEKTN